MKIKTSPMLVRNQLHPVSYDLILERTESSDLWKYACYIVENMLTLWDIEDYLFGVENLCTHATFSIFGMYFPRGGEKEISPNDRDCPGLTNDQIQELRAWVSSERAGLDAVKEDPSFNEFRFAHSFILRSILRLFEISPELLKKYRRMEVPDPEYLFNI